MLEGCRINDGRVEICGLRVRRTGSCLRNEKSLLLPCRFSHPAAAYRSGGGYARSEGTISRFEMTPDKKGNIDVKIDAAMRVVSFGISYGGWPLHMRFKLFQGSNLVPLIAGLQGYVMLPSQVNKMQLNGPSFRFY